MEVTKPADETVATNASDVAQLSAGFAIVLSFASLTMAVSWVALPSAENVSTELDSAMLAATRVTVTVAVSVMESELAVIVAVPSPTEVTSPPSEIAATSASDVAQLSAGLAIVLSFASLTMAVSWVALPSAENASAVSDSATLATT
jgi:hypothetical protein